MMDHAPGVHDIEASIFESQLFGIARGKNRRQAHYFEAAARVRDRPLGNIDTVDQSTGFGESLVICAKADSDLKDTLSFRTVERGKVLDVWLKLVPTARLLQIALPTYIA